MSLIGIADACGQIQDQIIQQGSGSTVLFTKTKKKQAEQADKSICKVEFNQPFYWLYSVPNLLVFQHLVTLYLSGFRYKGNE